MRQVYVAFGKTGISNEIHLLFKTPKYRLKFIGNEMNRKTGSSQVLHRRIVRNAMVMPKSGVSLKRPVCGYIRAEQIRSLESE